MSETPKSFSQCIGQHAIQGEQKITDSHDSLEDAKVCFWFQLLPWAVTLVALVEPSSIHALVLFSPTLIVDLSMWLDLAYGTLTSVIQVEASYIFVHWTLSSWNTLSCNLVSNVEQSQYIWWDHTQNCKEENWGILVNNSSTRAPSR